MDKKGLSFQLNESFEIEKDKLFINNGFYYLTLQLGDFKEFLILPNDKLPELVERVVSKINDCKTELEVFDLLIAEM